MRKMLLTILLATSVAMPALAQDRDAGERDRSEMREAREEARAARRAQRAEDAVSRADDAERSARREARRQAIEQQGGDAVVVRRGPFEQQAGERRRWGERRSNNDGMTAAIERQQAAERAREQAQAVAQEPRRDEPRYVGSRDGSLLGRALERRAERNGQVVVRRDRDDRPRYADRDRRWNEHWRHDRSYDWRNHRDRHRSIYRRGYYRDPYGWNYRRFSIGFSIAPSYYRSHYWLNDPWMYRLPPAYGPYRWVRYYDDALLVNVYSGQVVDVIYSFFW